MNENNKDVANTLNKYTSIANKSVNIGLDGIDDVNKWYENKVKESRIQTGVDNTIQVQNVVEENQIQTKVEKYNSLQTNENNTLNIKQLSKINTGVEDEGIKQDIFSKKINVSKRISTAVKGAKFINNSLNRFVKTGKDISSGMNENGIVSFKTTSSRIMTKPIKKVTNKITNKVTKTSMKYTKRAVKKYGKKFVNSVGKKALKTTSNLMIKIMKLLVKLIESTMKMLMSMLPQIAPILIILIAIASFCSFFGMDMNDGTKGEYEKYMISVQEEYDKTTLEAYNSGKIVDGTIEGKGMINWKAPFSIIQMLNGELNYDNAEKELLKKFKEAGLYEKITEETYIYEKETKDDNGNTKKETVTETKKVVQNPSLDDYINWCNNNFSVINNYKKKKKIEYDSKQTKFTDDEVEQIRLLYKSNYFFDLFSSNFKEKYAYMNVSIDDEKLQAIYDEFLKNAGKRYLMDHSNLKYDKCMDYYDCSSWVIHCLAHTGIKVIPNTGAQGIYKNHCTPINVNDRQAGDLIFLKDTYDTGEPGRDRKSVV